jgi:2-methylisocitrate lyase-like PEP mutase family enzyme
MRSYQTFLDLHKAGKPLLLGNAWDVSSAQIFEKTGFKAIGTSSAAIANSLGYEDGENISFDMLLDMVKKISRHINVPFSVDMERGYGSEPNTILSNLDRLYDAGVVGFNIEDTSREKTLSPVEELQKKIAVIRNHLDARNMKMYINARVDAYLRKAPSPLSETIRRIETYEQSGATGIFVPLAFDPVEIKKITSVTTLPVNVLATPELPSYNTLVEAGVRRISLGSQAFRAMQRELENRVKSIQEKHSYADLFI